MSVADDADVLMTLHTPAIAELQGSYGCAIVSPTIQEVRESLTLRLVKALVVSQSSAPARISDVTSINPDPARINQSHITSLKSSEAADQLSGGEQEGSNIEDLSHEDQDVPDAELDDLGNIIGVGPFEF